MNDNGGTEPKPLAEQASDFLVAATDPERQAENEAFQAQVDAIRSDVVRKLIQADLISVQTQEEVIAFDEDGISTRSLSEMIEEIWALHAAAVECREPKEEVSTGYDTELWTDLAEQAYSDYWMLRLVQMLHGGFSAPTAATKKRLQTKFIREISPDNPAADKTTGRLLRALDILITEPGIDYSNPDDINETFKSDTEQTDEAAKYNYMQQLLLEVLLGVNEGFFAQYCNHDDFIDFAQMLTMVAADADLLELYDDRLDTLAGRMGIEPDELDNQLYLLIATVAETQRILFGEEDEIDGDEE